MIHEPSPDDTLVLALRELPRHAAPAQAGARARAAFVASGRPSPMTRAGLPLVLAGVVGTYLVWAFSAAITVSTLGH